MKNKMNKISVYYSQGGSMRPVLRSGSQIWVESIHPDKFRAGDMLAYKSDGKNFIHRIWKINKDKKIFIVNDDAGITGTHIVKMEQVTGKPISFFNGLPGLIWGKLSNTAYQKGRNLKSILSAAFALCLILTCTNLYAATRIKTVEWNYGGYYSGTDSNNWQAGYIQINLPDAIATSPIKNAYLEIEYLASAGGYSDSTNIDVDFSTGTTPTIRADNITGPLVPENSRESDPMCVRVNVTSQITAWSNQNYALEVTVTGPDCNMFTAKLYITYYYNDTAELQVKTVRFPILSSSIGADEGIAGVASFLAQRSAGTNSFKYKVELPESGTTRKQVWFEVRGYRQSGGSKKNDGSIYCQIGASGAEPTMTFDSALIDSYKFRYLSSQSEPAGFYEDIIQILNVVTVQEADTNVLGGEVVITYEFPGTASTKLKTVKYFLCQGTGGASNDFTVPVFLNEVGASIQRIYALVHGSYDSTSNYQIPLNSKIAGEPLSQRLYSVITDANQASGFEFYYDLGEKRSYWVNGSTVNVTWTDDAALGGVGMELIITYTYTSEITFTDYYTTFAGQTDDEVASATYSDNAFSIYFPDPETPIGLKTLRDAYLKANFIEGDATVTQDPSTTINVNSSGQSQTVNHNSTSENFQVSVLYDFSDRITPSSTTATANYTLTGDPFNVAGCANVLYDYIPVPSSPTALTQYEPDGVTEISSGTWINYGNLTFKYNLEVKFAGESIYPVFEVKSTGISFDGIGLSTGTQYVIQTSSVCEVAISTGQGQYHWRASAYSSAGRSEWVNYETPGELHFGVDLTSPTAPAPSSPENGYITSDQTPTLSWSGVTDLESGTENYTLQIATSTDFGTVTYSSETANTSVALDQALDQNTYYWRLRTHDISGNIGDWQTAWSIIIDTAPPPEVTSLTSPDDQSITSDPNISFSWTGVTDSPAGVNRYVLQVSTSADFSKINYSSVTAATSASLTVAESSYTWRVNVYDYAMNYTTSTATRSFEVKTSGPDPVDTLNEPLNNTTTDQVTISFDWESAESADYYYLQLSTSATFYPIQYSSKTVLTSASLTIDQSSYTWRVNTQDVVLNYTTSTVRYTIVVDTTSPNEQIVNTSDSDAVPLLFRNSGNVTADVNIYEGGEYGLSLINEVEYMVGPNADNANNPFVSWTSLYSAPPGVLSYTDNWVISFSSLEEWTTNYVHLHYSDIAGNEVYTYNAFDILKDTTPPTAPAPSSPDDDLITNSGSISFSWGAASELRSGTSFYMLQISTSVNDFYPIAYSSQTAAAQASLSEVSEEIYYWRVYAVDKADNYSAYSSTRLFTVDLSTPYHVNNVTGDLTPRPLNTATYDVRFYDDGNSQLDKFELRSSTKPALALPLIDWTLSGTVISGATYYSTPWSLPHSVWESLVDGNTSYISIRTYDLSGNTSTYLDAFFVKKIQGNVNISDNEGVGEDLLWRSTSTERAYNIDFTANSNLQAVQYKAHSNSDYGDSGTRLFDWKDIPDVTLSGTDYDTNWYVGSSDFIDLVDGNTNYISVRCWAVGTATAAAYNVFVVKKDTTPPNLITHSQPLDASATGQLTVDFSWQGAVDLASGATYYLMQVSTSSVSSDSGAVVYSSYTTQTLVTSSQLNQSTYYWFVQAKDMAGNWNDFSSGWSVQVDTTLPDIPTMTAPADTSTTNYISQTFSWNPASDNGPAGLHCYYLEISTVTDFSTVYYSSVTTNTSIETDLSLSATYYWNVEAIDRAQNYSSVTSSWSVVVDTIAPQVPIITAPLDSFATNQISVTFEWSSSDWGPASTGIEEFELLVSTSADFNPIYHSSITTLTSYTTDFAENNYWWRVRAHDYVENCSDYSSDLTFIVDQSSPAATNLISPADDTRTNLLQVGFAWNSVSDVGYAGLDNYELTVSTDINFNVVHYSSITKLTNATIDFTEQNILYWRVRGKDAVDNYAIYSSTYSITIDTTSPTIDDNQSGDDTWLSFNSGSYNVDFLDTPAVYGAGLSSASYRVFSATTAAGAPAGSELVSYTQIFNKTLPERTSYYVQNWSISGSDWSSLNQGSNFVFVNAYDLAGSSVEASAYVFHIKKDTQAPTITNYETPTSWETVDRTRNVDFSDSYSGVKVASYTAYPQTNWGGSASIEWTTIYDGSPVSQYTDNWNLNFNLLDPGTNYISLSVCDYAGNIITTKDVFKVWKDTIPPNDIASITPSQGSSSGEVDLDWTSPADDSISNPYNTNISSYIVKYKTSNFSDRDDFLNTGSTFYQVWTPASSGNPESETVTGLTEGTTYFIGILPVDKAGNYSVSAATASDWAQRVVPDQITDLDASAPSELEAGYARLQWTSVGDDEKTGGAAEGYVLKYASFSFTSSDWDSSPSVHTFSQTWEPAAPRSSEEEDVSGFSPGEVVYYAIKAYDDASPGANYSIMSNVTSVTIALSGPADGMFVYGEGTLDYARYYKVTSAGTSWAGPYNSSSTAANIYWVVQKACPVVRNEKMVGTLSSSGDIYLQRYDGDNDEWNNISEWPVSLATSVNSAYRAFDIAYEQTSGRAMVAYRSTTDGNVVYQVWSSTAADWVVDATELTVDPNLAYATIQWVRLEPRPGTDEIMLVALDANNDIFAYRWTGSGWSNNQELTASAYTNVAQCFDLAWENTNGDCLVLWGQTGRSINYGRWDTSLGSWQDVGTEGPDIGLIGGNGAYWIKLDGDRAESSNNIAMASLDNQNDWNVSVWNGSTWAAPDELSASMDGYTTRLIDIKWEKDTNDCLAVGVLSGSPAQYVAYSEYSSGSWGTASNYTGYDLGNATDLRWLQLMPDPNSNKIVLIAANNDTATSVDLRSLNWDGDSLTGGSELSSVGSTNLYEFFYMALDRHDEFLPTISDSQTGDDTWRTSNSGTYNVSFNDSGGSKLSKVQTMFSGATTRTWADEITGINADTYPGGWSLLSTSWDALEAGRTYVSLKVFDGAGNTDSHDDAFYVQKDTQPPIITNNISGSFTTWYNTDIGNVVNIDFSDQSTLSLLTTAQYLVYPDVDMGGSKITDGMIFDYISSPQNTHTSDFGVNWDLLASGTNYVSIKSYDVAGNVKISTDAFKILKDTTAPPEVTTLSSPLNNTTTNQSLIDFSWGAVTDLHSLVKNYTLQLSTAADFSIVNYSSITVTNSASIDVIESSYSWRVNVQDNALNYTTSTLKYVVVVDTTPPEGVDTLNTPLNNTTTNQTTIDFDWDPVTGGDTYILQLSTAADFSVINYSSSTALDDATLTVDQSSYTWRVNVVDATLNYSTSTVTYVIVVDSTLPNVSVVNTADSQQTPPLFRKSGNITADINFTEGGEYGEALLSSLKYKVSSEDDGTGSTIINWTNIPGFTSGDAVFTDNWTITFTTLEEWATNYVHIYYSDIAGNDATSYAVFDILKDTTSPDTPSLVSPDDNLKTNSGSISFDWSNIVDLRSGTSNYFLQISTSVNDFYPVSYSSQTAVSQASITGISEDSYYWRTYVADKADNYSANSSTRTFLVDLSTPYHVNNVTGDTTERTVNNGTYDFRFKDNGNSLLDKFELRASTKPAIALPLIDWTLSGTVISGATYYNTPWNLPNSIWEALETGNTTFISVRTYDLAGNTSTYLDAFFVKRVAGQVDIDDNEDVGEDDVWRSTSTERAFDIDFHFPDVVSTGRKAQYKAHSDVDYTNPSTRIFDWVDIGLTISNTYYYTDWQVDAAEFVQLTGDNTNYISVRCWDTGTSTATAYNVFVVKKDTTPPVTVTHSAPLNAAATDQLTVDFSWQAASDLSSGSTLYYLIVSTSSDSSDAGAVNYSSYTIQTSVISDQLNQATYYWYVKTKDMANNWADFSSGWSVQVDTTSPPVPSFTSPSDNFTTNYVTQTLDWGTVTDNGPAGISGYYLEVSTMSDFSALYYSSITLSGTSAITTDLSLSATYYWNVESIDRAQNYSSVTSTYAVIMDTIAPNIPATTAPLDSFTTNQISIAFEWSSSDTGPAATGIEEFELLVSTMASFDPIYHSSITTLTSYTTDFAENKYWWKVRAHDFVENYSDYSTALTFIVDRSSPLPTTLSTPVDDTRSNALQQYFVWNSTSDVGYAGLDSYELVISTDIGFGIVNYSSVTKLTNATIDFDEQNIFYWKVRSNDIVGNYADYSSTYTITIDTTSPSITDNQSGDDTWLASNSGTYDVDFYDTPEMYGAGLSSASYKVFSATTAAGAPSGSELVVYTQVFNKTLPERTTYYEQSWSISASAWDSLNQGYNFVFVNAYDLAGSTVEASSYNFHIKKDTQPPSITNYETSPSWESVDRARNVDFTDYRSGVVVASYTVYAQAEWGGSPLISWTSIYDGSAVSEYTTDWNLNFDLLDPGTNYISLRVEDALNQVIISTDVFVVWKDTIPPNDIASLAASQGTSGGQVDISWNAPADDTITDPTNTQVSSYTVKYKTSNFTDKSDFFTTGTTFYQTWIPDTPGNPENETVTGLVEGTTYYIGIILKDKAGNYSDGITTDSEWAQREAPDQITDLAGSSPAELDPGQANLSWTAVGDDGKTGTASGFVVKYASFPFTSSDWDISPNVNEYTQGWTSDPPGSIEQETVGGFSPGELVYFAIKTYDDASPGANYSVMSNTASVTTRASGPADGIICYSTGTSVVPAYRTVTSAGTSWGGQSAADTVTGTIYWQVLRTCPVVRDEKHLGTLSSSGDLYLQRWDGQGQDWDTSLLIETSVDSAYRAYDIAYEQTSGRAMVAYRSSNGGRFYYRIWSSTAAAWIVSETEITMNAGTAIRWVRLEPRPGTDEIMIVTLDASNDIYANNWNGSSWGTPQLMSANAYRSDAQDFDVAWENTTGTCVVMWGENDKKNPLLYSEWNGASWNVGSTGPDIGLGQGSSVYWIKLAADRNSGSDNIAMASLDSLSDWNVSVWNGAIWASPTELSSDVDAFVTRTIDIAWEQDTSHCLAVGVVSGANNRYVTFSEWDTGTWDSAGQYTGANLGNSQGLQWMQLVPDPNSNMMVIVGANSNGAGSVDLNTLNWNGENWTGSGTSLTDQGATNAYEFFSLVLDRHDLLTPTYNDNQLGDNKWRNTNDGTGGEVVST